MSSYGNNVLLAFEGPLAFITINRPKALNALNRETMLELDAALQELETKTDSVFAVIVTGAGDKSFVAGADITVMQPLSAPEARDWGRLGQKVFMRLEQFQRPVIAAINGFALGGGCELCMACDIRVAADTAKLGQPEVNLGITPGYAGTQRLPRLVGKGQAKLMIYTADVISAEEAYRIGLVQAVAPQAELMDYCKKLAGKIISKSPFAVAQSKLAINKGLEMESDAAHVFEAEIFGNCFATAEQKEGMSAYIEKRKPDFSKK
jgi:enoyl-CoA hydratase